MKVASESPQCRRPSCRRPSSWRARRRALADLQDRRSLASLQWSLVNRYYDPTTGQFLTRDPLVGLTNEPYGYVGGSPLNGTDPLGLICVHIPFTNDGCNTDLHHPAKVVADIHQASTLLGGVTGACAGVMFWNPLGWACAPVAGASALLSAGTGIALAAERQGESPLQLGLDTGAAALTALSDGMLAWADEAAGWAQVYAGEAAAATCRTAAFEAHFYQGAALLESYTARSLAWMAQAVSTGLSFVHDRG